MDDINVPIFGQAKLEYTKQLVDILYMNIYDGIRSIYDDAKVVYVKKRAPVVQIFRSLLENVPKWNSEIIQKETDRIEKTSNCDWLDELLTAVFISHTRILMSIGSNQNFNKINVTIPKTTTFIHKSYINIAREVWKNPYLFDEQVPGHEYQRNMKQLEDMIKLNIEDTIRRQVPIKEILREHLENSNEQTQPQNQLDMKTLVDELRKATNPVNNDTNYDSNYETDEEDKIDEGNGGKSRPNTNDFSSIFNKEQALPSEIIDSPINDISVKENIVNNTYVTPETSPFSDKDDPNEDQIKKATQNIVLNDITEPVIEASYDNTDIVSPTKSANNDNKLENMVKELSMGGGSTTAPTVKIDKLNNTSPTNNQASSNTLTTVVKKEGGVNTSTTKSEPLPTTSPFSFDNLYSGIKGQGKVEDVKGGDITKSKETIVIKDNSIPTTSTPTTSTPTTSTPTTSTPTTSTPTTSTTDTTSTNADVMKEVISIDKKEEQIDDTKSLDIFFSDIQKMVNPSLNPMEPIKEETKYTLFEDASEKE